MCLGWRPTFHSSTSFLPKEPSLELPTVFMRNSSNNTLDLGACRDRRHGLHHSAKAWRMVLVSLFLFQNVKLVSFFLSFFFSSWENSCQWMQCPFQIQYYANCVSAHGVNKYVHEASWCREMEPHQCVDVDPRSAWGPVNFLSPNSAAILLPWNMWLEV